jgi:hypothetical protein
MTSHNHLSRLAPIGVVFIACLLVHSRALGHSQETVRERQMDQRIRAGEVQAVTEAGTSGNRAYVSALKSVLKNRKHPVNTRERARLALARLGESYQMQEFWCGAIAEDPNPDVGALLDVGGWFMFQAIQKIFDGVGEREFRRGVQKTPSDVMYEAPKYLVVQFLPLVIQDPPIGVPRGDEKIERFVQVWREWIRSHDSELRTLQPTGEGVDFSAEACKNGQRRRKR